MRRLGPFGRDRRVMVAVSGGADSTALALLLSRWGDPVAAIVDHGLRPDSAADATLTAARLERLGLQTRILRAGLSPGPAAAERAREARYRLLLGACREAGCPDLLLAHHAADQAETVRMRRDAGSGAAGLAAMSAIAYRAEARLLRPLLSIPPARFRATLRAAGLDWVEDPTNADLRTVRGRLRAEMDDAERAALLTQSQDAGRVRARDAGEIAAALAMVRLYPEGFAVIPGPLPPLALSSLIWTISGRRYPPPRDSLAAGLRPRTTHGVRFAPAGRLGPGILLVREAAAAATEPLPATPGTLWDGRFYIRRAPPGHTVGPLGNDAPRLRRASPLPSAVLRVLPAFRSDGKLTCVPHLFFPDPAACRSVDVYFRPSRPTVGKPATDCVIDESG